MDHRSPRGERGARRRAARSIQRYLYQISWSWSPASAEASHVRPHAFFTWPMQMSSQAFEQQYESPRQTLFAQALQLESSAAPDAQTSCAQAGFTSLGSDPPLTASSVNAASHSAPFSNPPAGAFFMRASVFGPQSPSSEI